MAELIEQAGCAVDAMGRATIKPVQQMSATQLAGPQQQGKRTGRDIADHGMQKRRVALKKRQLGVDKPRLRKRRRVPGEPGEVQIQAYASLQKDERLALDAGNHDGWRLDVSLRRSFARNG